MEKSLLLQETVKIIDQLKKENRSLKSKVKYRDEKIENMKVNTEIMNEYINVLIQAGDKMLCEIDKEIDNHVRYKIESVRFSFLLAVLFLSTCIFIFLTN